MKSYRDALSEQLAAFPIPADGTVFDGLAVGELDAPFRALLEAIPGWQWQLEAVVTPNQLAGLGRLDASITISRLQLGDDALVARIRDVHSPVVWLIEPPEISAERARSLAFNVLHTPVDADDRWLFGHDIASYKATPDWLNAKYWANPERWDQNRW
jgi:hypothetical protein